MNIRTLIPISFQILSKLNASLAGKLAWELFCRPRRISRTKEEDEFWRSGKEITFVSGRKARSWGDGPLIFFIHGWESWGATFYKMIPTGIDC